MRFSKYVPLLVAILPLALAQYQAPPLTGTCSSGAHRCENNTLQLCGDDANWQTVKECSKTAYCFAQNTADGGGDCYPLVRGGNMQCSTINDHRCNINSLQECGDHGYWSTIKNCTQTAYCFAQDTVDGGGDCRPLILDNDNQCSTIDIHRCSTNTLQICGSHGYWKTTKNCTQTAYCFAQDTANGGGDCHPLVGGLDEQCSTTNEYHCDNNALQECTNHGYWKTLKKCKQSETCSVNSKYVDGGLCLPSFSNGDQLRCKANAHRCHDNKIQDCTMREHWSDRTTCGETQVCVENCSQGGCKPYCLERNQYYTILAGTNNSSTSDVTPKVTRSEPESCDRPSTGRCMYDFPVRTQSCTNGTWVDKEICPLGTICWADKDGEEKAECAELPEVPYQSTSIKDQRSEIEHCNQRRVDRCAFEPARIQECAVGHMWWDREVCPKGFTCWKDDDLVEGHARSECVALPQLKSKMYSTLKTTRNVPELKTKRAALCIPGDLACDKDRRFLFTCDNEGNWETPLQCFGPNYCRPEGSFALTCAGFPKYGGDDGKCNSHCETMDYLYCISGNWNSPDVITKCLEGMCKTEDCRACDRCNFKLPYGVKLQPDLNTLVPVLTPDLVEAHL